MSILITGGTGSLGSFLAREMIKQSYRDIVLFDFKPDYERVSEISDKVKVVTGNITDWADIVKVIKEYEIKEIFHLAALLSTEVKEKPFYGFKINVEGTINILEASRILDVKKLIFTSSISTFGLGVSEPVKETYRQEPTNLYGITKVTGELWSLYYQQQYNIDIRALRFPRIVNPGRYGVGVALFPSSMIEKAALNKYHEVEVDEKYRVPIIYIKDAVNALILLYKARQVKTRIYNINGLLPTAKQILETVKEYVPDAPVKFSKKPIAPHLAIPLHYDDSKAKEELGWKIEYTLDKMVKDFISEIKRKQV